MNAFARPLTILTALVLAGTAFPAVAAQVNFSAALTGMAEVPPNDSTATGTLSAEYDSETNIFNFTVTYDGLTGDATAAHFHGPANPGETAPPVLPIDGALTSPIAGTATLTDAQEAELLSGMWYFNVHTAAHPDGEIRGQVLQSMTSNEMSSMMSSESGMISSEEPSGMSSESSSVDVSTSVSVSVSASVDPSSDLSSVSSDLSSTLSSVSSELSSTLSSLDPSVSVSASVSVSGEVSVSAP